MTGNHRQEHVGWPVAPGVNRHLSAENGRRPVPGLGVQERPTPCKFVLHVRQLPPAPSGIDIILAPNGKGNSIARMNDNAGRPDLDVELVDLPRGQGLFLIVRVIRTVRGADLRVELAVRCPESPLSDGCMRIDRPREDHLFQVGSEHP